MNNRWRCKECDWIGVESELLYAPNPFDPKYTLCGCPTCKSIGSFESLCDWGNCAKEASSGTPLADGRYVWRCHHHRPEKMGEQTK